MMKWFIHTVFPAQQQAYWVRHVLHGSGEAAKDMLVNATHLESWILLQGHPGQ